MKRGDVADVVASCATLAALLEVSAYPKPGNVHRTRDLPDTKYEHFLAGGVAMTKAIRKLALRGYEMRVKPRWENLHLGRRILEATLDMLNWQRGGNVNLGIILLFAPLAGAAGAIIDEDGRANVQVLRGAISNVIRNTTPRDAIAVYRAIRLAVPGRVLGRVEELDVQDDSSLLSISDRGLNLLDVFQRCSGRDSICGEWVSNFEITFNIGHPYLKGKVEMQDVNSSIVDTYLRLLSSHPDSLIIRKSGQQKAEFISEKALEILQAGGAVSEHGRRLLWALDDELHGVGGALNPGTTADLTAASIFLLLLEGWRP